jgi:predicted ATPase with chaperone activity
MRHYHDLIEIENVSIDLDVLQSTVRVLTYGMPEANKKDVEYAMHNVTDRLEELSSRLRDRFDTLFNAIRDEEDENKRETKKRAKNDKV